MAVPMPAHLGRFASIDPFGLEPGTIIWDRFCVVGPVRHEGPHWSAPVVDIERKLGLAPHHRLDLQYLDVPRDAQNRLHRAFSAETNVQPQAHAVIETGTGMVVLCGPPEGEPVRTPIAPARVLDTATALAGMLARLHDAGVTGIAITLENLRFCAGRLRLRGFAHLRTPGDAAQDVRRLTALLEAVGRPRLETVIHPRPTSAKEMWERARALGAAAAGPTFFPPHPPFVGRQRALQRLDVAVSRARIARASVVVVHGPRGIGKTRLVDEFVSLLQRQTSHRPVILRGHYKRDPSEPHIGLAAALGDLIEVDQFHPSEHTALFARLRNKVDPFGRLLCRFSPRLEALLDDLPEPPPIDLSERYRRHIHVVAEGIRSLGTPDRPLVITLDNLEEADSGSLSILQQLVHGDPTHHTVVVVGVRGEVPLPLRHPDLQVVELSPLSRDEVTQMLEESLQGPVEGAEAAAHTLHDETLGLPLAAWSTLQAWLERGVLSRQISGEPWLFDARRDTSASVQDLFIHRLLRATEDQRWLALLAALRGGHAGRHWLASLVTWEKPRLRNALLGLEQSGLMLADDDGHLYFPHDSVRNLLLEASPNDELRKGHWRIAQWLVAQGPSISAAQLAFHAELGQAENLGDLQALHLAAGAELLAVYDLSRASWHYEQALHRARTTAERCVALAGCADAEVLAHNTERAAQYYSELINLAEDPAEAVLAAANAVFALYVKAGADLAFAIGVKGLARIGHHLPNTIRGKCWAIVGALLRPAFGDPQEPMALRDALCRLYWALTPGLLVRDPLTVASLTLRARHCATGLQTPNASVSATFYGALRGTLGHYRAAHAALTEAEEIATAAGSDWALGVCHHIRGHIVELPANDYHVGQRSLERAVAYFRKTGDVSVATGSMFFRAAYGCDREPASTTLEWLEEASAMARRQGTELCLVSVESLRLLIEARQGKADIVERAFELNERVLSTNAAPHDVLMARTYLAMTFTHIGRTALADEQIELGQMVFERLVGCPDICNDFFVAKAIASLARPNLDRSARKQARKQVARLGRRARISPRLRPAWMFARMKYAAACGKRKQAIEYAASLLAKLEWHGQKYWAAEAHHLLADLKRADDTLLALTHERAARDLWDELGVQSRGRSFAGPRPTPRALPASPGTTTAEVPPWEPQPPHDLAVEQVLEQFRPTIHKLLANVAFVVLQAEPGLRVRCDKAAFETLLVNLICTSRDAVHGATRMMVTARRAAVDQVQAAEFAGAQAGEYVAIAAEAAPGPPAPVLGGLAGCRRIATRMGGFLRREAAAHDGLRLILYLPLTSCVPLMQGSRARATVIHVDPLVRRTLVAALNQFEFACRHATPDSGHLAEIDNDTVVFADTQTAFALQGGSTKVVEILSRTAVPQVKGAYAIRVPFAMGEFMELLRQIDRDSSEKEAQIE